MPTTTRDRSDEIQALEELWAAPAAAEPQPKPEQRRDFPLVPGAVLAGAWLAFWFVMVPYEPEPAAGMTNPLWGDIVAWSLLVAVLAAAALGPVLPKAGFALAGIGGLLLVVIAVGCRMTTHHMGNWWLAELAAAVVLTGLAAVGLRERLRGE
jgi:hypothetical protein